MNNIWENPKCNFCGSRGYKVIWNKVSTWITGGEYRIVSCKKCNLVYLSPRPKKKYILNYYPPETYWGTGVVNSNNKEGKKRRDDGYGYLYGKILEERKTGSILDLGAGTGLFLSNFKKLGWETSGVELSKQACRYAKRVYDVKLITGSFPEVKLPVGKYDVVTFNGCLEHLYKPKESLIKIYKLLNENGIVEITVPNYDSLGRLIFGKQWYALQPPSHLYHFTPAIITSVLEVIGFKDIEIRHNYQNHNLYILFESVRLSFSPKFRGENIGSFVRTESSQISEKFSFKMEIGKFLARLFSLLIAGLETVLGRGEVMTIYAKKN